jgi:uncharacterized protein
MADRLRDRLGRPLSPGADPALAAPPVIDPAGQDDAAVWRIALDYLDRGLPFHAHEVFELRWRAADEQDRHAWRALAQWGAALTHEARGNAEGARRLAERTLATLADSPRVPPGVDPDLVRASCSRLLTR